jgi:hypothetical protein
MGKKIKLAAGLNGDRQSKGAKGPSPFAFFRRRKIGQ